MARTLIFIHLLSQKKQLFFNRKGLPVGLVVGIEAGLINKLDSGESNPFFNAAKELKRKRLLGNS